MRMMGDVFDLFALLHEIDDADVVVREDARDFGKDADAVAHGQADIVAAAEVPVTNFTPGSADCVFLNVAYLFSLCVAA